MQADASFLKLVVLLIAYAFLVVGVLLCFAPKIYIRINKILHKWMERAIHLDELVIKNRILTGLIMFLGAVVFFILHRIV